MTYLDIARVDVAFDGRAVLADVTLSLDQGETVALLGPSGSGKSTLLRVVAGIIRPDRGTVTLDSRDITNLPTHRRGVGMVFQDNQLFPHLTVRDNVGFGMKMAGVAKAQRHLAADRWLERVDLAGFGDRSVGDLSGGEAKRVALARTLGVEPSVVLLDEPLTGLDRELHDRLALDVAALLRDLAITAILVTHDPDEAAVMANRSVLIGDINAGTSL